MIGPRHTHGVHRMRSTYTRSFGWSLVGHLVAALLLALFGLWRGFSCRRAPREIALPIEFLVETHSPGPTPPEAPTPEPPEPVPPEPVPPTPPQPTPDPPEPTPPREPPPVAERPPPPRRPIQVSTNLVRRPVSQPRPAPRPAPPAAPPAAPRLTPEQVAEMLAAGARPADRTVLAGEDERALAAIRDALYTAWIRPSAADRSNRPVLIEIRLDRFGNVTGRSIAQRSGSSVLDESALRAAQAVRQIRNIPSGFSDRYPAVFVRFELE